MLLNHALASPCNMHCRWNHVPECSSKMFRLAEWYCKIPTSFFRKL